MAARAAAVALILAILGLGGVAQASSALYVDRANPNCSNSGTGSVDQPFCTISAAVSKVAAGNTVFVSSGTYSESVTVSKSGTAAAPIVVTSAAGASVTITGAGTSTRALTVSGQYVRVSGFTVQSPSGQDVYVSAGNTTVSALSVSGTTSHGILVAGTSSAPISNVTIVGNQATTAGKPNISSSALAAGIYLSNVTNSTVSGNTADRDTLAGIYLGSGTSNLTVTGNVTYSNAAGIFPGSTHGLAPGIDVRSGPNLIMQNRSFNNEDTGLQFYTGAHDNVVTDNLTYNDGDHGIDDYNAPHQVIVGNTVYDNFTAGINLEGTTGSFGATVQNNITVNNGMNSTRTTSNIRVDSASVAGSIVDYNVVSEPQQKVCGTTGTNSCVEYIWGSTSYTSLGAFAAATGQEAHGKQADPLFMSPTTGDFRPQAGSPVIDSANSGVAGQQTMDFSGDSRVDDPATPNTGAGARTYDDRGAYEYQPPGTDAPPAAALSVTPSSGTVPLAVTADASASTDTDTTPIATYTFDFGDGSATVGPQSAPTATHTYGSAGTFTVTVTVTDTAGLSSSATGQVTAASGTDAPPAAALSVTPSSGTVPLAVTADASASTDTDTTPIATYTFDFGDGSATVGPQSAPTATHTYGSAGTFTVTVTVTDTAGLSSSATGQVTAKQNRVGNSGFETGTSGWNTSGSGVTCSLAQAPGGHSGSWSAALTNTSTTSGNCTLNDSPNWVTTTSAGTYTGTIWVRGDSGGSVLKLRFREYVGSTLAGSVTAQATLTTTWQQVTVAYTIASPGSTLDFNAYVSTLPAGTSFYADDAAITLG